MDASAAGPPVSSPDATPPTGPAVPGLPSGPGWLVLRDCPVGGGGPPVDLALLHTRIGVALVHLADTAAASPDPADRFRRALDDRRFPAIFGGYPPVVGVAVPADRLADLGQILSARFRAEPPLALEGGDAWVPTARAALEAAPVADDRARLATAAARGGEVSPWRAAVSVAAAAAAGAAVAAAVVSAPPLRDAGHAPAPEAAAVATAPRPAEPSQWAATPPAAAVGAAPAPDAADDLPSPANAPPTDDAAGGDGASAAEVVPQGAGGGPSHAASWNGPVPAAPADTGEGAADAPSSSPFEAAAVAPPGSSAPVGEPDAPPRSRAADPSTDAPTRPAAPRAAPVAAAPAAAKRCRDVLVKTTLGERLSDADKEHLRRGCDRPRD